MKKSISLLFGFFLVVTGVAYGQSTITFDDLTGNDFNTDPPVPIPNGYQGLNWNNFYPLNTTGFPLSGYVNGTVSPSNIAYNAYGNPAHFSATVPFILISGDFTSARHDGMSLEVTGLNGTSTVFDETFLLNVDGPSFLTFPSSPVTEVDFATTGGVYVTGYLGGNPTMVMDNLTIAPVPEPGAGWLVAAGLSTLALLRRKRLTKL